MNPRTTIKSARLLQQSVALHKDPAESTAEKIISQITQLSLIPKQVTLANQNPAAQTAEKIIGQIMSYASAHRPHLRIWDFKMANNDY